MTSLRTLGLSVGAATIAAVLGGAPWPSASPPIGTLPGTACSPTTVIGPTACLKPPTSPSSTADQRPTTRSPFQARLFWRRRRFTSRISSSSNRTPSAFCAASASTVRPMRDERRGRPYARSRLGRGQIQRRLGHPDDGDSHDGGGRRDRGRGQLGRPMDVIATTLTITTNTTLDDLMSATMAPERSTFPAGVTSISPATTVVSPPATRQARSRRNVIGAGSTLNESGPFLIIGNGGTGLLGISGGGQVTNNNLAIVDFRITLLAKSSSTAPGRSGPAAPSTLARR